MRAKDFVSSDVENLGVRKFKGTYMETIKRL
jgi:hypothetical protein